MALSRYGEARTLVRRLCRLPGEEGNDFKNKVARLRKHFQRFNVDTSELCQWIMGLRRQNPSLKDSASFGTLGDFLLEPRLDGQKADEATRDRLRLRVFDAVAGISRDADFSDPPWPAPLRQAMQQAAHFDLTPTAHRLFERLRCLDRRHRLVLLKAAAEWIVARYQRGMGNWVRRREEWEKEKSAWEARHPALTAEVREGYNRVFRSLHNAKGTTTDELKRKNPRICSYQRLREGKDNCVYAGQKGHGPLCWRYVEFVKSRDVRHFNDKWFWDDAQRFAELCLQNGWQSDRVFKSPNLPAMLFSGQKPQDSNRPFQRFSSSWSAYLQAMGLTFETAVSRGRLQHCQKIGKTWEESKCEWNRHTELCYQLIGGDSSKTW